MHAHPDVRTSSPRHCQTPGVKATQISRLAASVAGVTLLTACGHSSNGEAGRSCAASVLLEGHRYNAADRYGVPIKLASSLEQPVTVPGCLDGERDEATARGWAIEGIPTTVAIYAPQAYGAEYILIKDGVDLKPAYALHLDRSR